MKRKIHILAILLYLCLLLSSCSDDKIIVGADTAVELEGTGLNPDANMTLSLEQNIPNPFNPATMIRFHLPRSLHVTLKVFTDDWQEVAALVDDYRLTGHHQVVFSATNLPSGEYYYTLEADNEISEMNRNMKNISFLHCKIMKKAVPFKIILPQRHEGTKNHEIHYKYSCLCDFVAIDRTIIFILEF